MYEGLIYPSVEVVMRTLGVPRAQRAQVFAELQVMELEFLEIKARAA